VRHKNPGQQGGCLLSWPVVDTLMPLYRTLRENSAGSRSCNPIFIEIEILISW
jgi:hypothetical protein